MVDAENIPQATNSMIWVTVGVTGVQLFTFEDETRDRAQRDEFQLVGNTRSCGSTNPA